MSTEHKGTILRSDNVSDQPAWPASVAWLVLLFAGVVTAVLALACRTDGSFDASSSGARLSWTCRHLGTFPSTTTWSLIVVAALLAANAWLLKETLQGSPTGRLLPAIATATLVNATVLVLGLAASITYAGQG